jgi:hypothetical protein
MHDQINLSEYNEILNEMSSQALSHGTDHLICCGDFNTDFKRNLSLHTRALVDFLEHESLCNLQSMPCYDVDFSFESFVDGSRSIIDQVFVSDNLKVHVESVRSIHSPENMSDHAPLICELKLANMYVTQPQPSRSKPLWSRATPTEIEMYRLKLRILCEEYEPPDELVECDDAFCEDPNHIQALQGFHDYLVAACLTADSEIPHSNRIGRKRLPGWTEHVKPLHQTALFWHSIWVECGRPQNGAVADVRRHTRRQYHKAANRAAYLESALRFERMAQNFEHATDKTDFWTQVKKMRSSAGQHPSSVDGAVEENDIANVFSGKYEILYNSVGYDEVQLEDTRLHVNRLIVQHGNNDCHSISVDDVRNGASGLKRNKNDGAAGLYTDHVKNAPLLFYCHLSKLFNGMFQHAFSPTAFNVSVLIPIPKNARKSLCDSDNYRAIALSSILNELLDKIILQKCNRSLKSSCFQFGFKKQHSTNMCSFVVNEVIEHFVSRKSPVYACLLDCTKAFDRLEYVRMFDVLLKKSLCPFVTRLLLCMYKQQTANVKWQNSLSQSFHVKNGVKQGGVISPVIFTIYMDALLTKLEAKGAGCWMDGLYVGGLAYADDVILLAPSRKGLITMLDICSVYAQEFDVKFNASKSKLLLFGKCDPVPIVFMHKTLDMVPDDKHLGIPIGRDSNKLLVQSLCKEIMTKTNMLYAHFRHLPIDLLYHLFKTYCTPMYGCQLLDFNSPDTEKIYVTWRKAIRFLFQLPSTTHSALLPHICNDVSFPQQLHLRTAKFYSSCLASPNRIVRTCAERARNGTSRFARSLTLLSHAYKCTKSDLVRGVQFNMIDNDCDMNVVTASLIRALLTSRRDSCGMSFFSKQEIEFAITILCNE